MDSPGRIHGRGARSVRAGMAFAAFFMGVMSGGHAALGQCVPQWRAGDGIAGVSDSANAAVMWDPDGNGPEAEVLVVGGSFEVAGDVRTQALAFWDGDEWRSLGNGVGSNRFDEVYALAVFNGDLIVAGSFDVVGGIVAPHIARWDGTSWHSLGDGFRRGVRALTVFEGELIAAGAYNMSGAGVQNVMAWNGSAWRSLGGLEGLTSSMVRTFAVHQGDLFAGGEFSAIGGVEVKGVARWDGKTWHAVGEGLETRGGARRPGTVSDLQEYDGSLYAVGSFDYTGELSIGGMARWDGQSWHRTEAAVATNLNTLAVYGDELIIGGGFFDSSGKAALSGVARWSEANGVRPLDIGTNGAVNNLVIWGSSLVAVGDFTRAGQDPARRVALWDGVMWTSLGDGNDGMVRALTEFDGKVIAGGYFAQIGGIDANSIAAWDGGSWSAIGTGISGAVLALTEFDGKLIAAGSFKFAGEVAAASIAAWDGQSWEPLGLGMDGDIYALAVYRGELFAAGYFLAANNTAVDIARWDGKRWRSVGNGLYSDGIDAEVNALVAYNGELIAAGSFDIDGGAVADGIARWNGKEWRSLGGGITGRRLGAPITGNPQSLIVNTGELFVGGFFMRAGDADVSNLARWDGEAWHAMGRGSSANVSTLTVYNGMVTAFGMFPANGSQPAGKIAAWNGSNWERLMYGPDGVVHTMTAWNGELLVGGDFLFVDDVLSAAFARWGPVRECGADVNCSGNLDSQDFFDFLHSFFAASPLADFNNDGFRNSQDFFDFLAAFFEHC